MAVLVLAGAFALAGHVRGAGVAVAVALGAVAVLRAVLPTAKVGAFAIRSRGVDVATCLVGAGALVFFALTAPSL